jgi:outer membrane lipoprotein-sorting protein
MLRILRAIVPCTVLWLVVVTSGAAWAEDLSPKGTPDAQEILRRMDAAISGYDDQEMEVDLIIHDVDGSSKTYGMIVRQKGTDKRLVRFTSGEIKGMSTLILARGRIYAYLPGFKKVRRISAHNMNQSFAGSDFTNDDMAVSSWGKFYDVTLLSEDAESWTLKGTPKTGDEGKGIGYGFVRLRVMKEGGYQQRVDYFNKDGVMIKQLVGTELGDFEGGLKRYRSVVMQDPRTGHKTEMRIKTFLVNQGLKDKAFTKRQLRWGR